MLDTMCVTLGGRVAEQLVFGRITTGAMDDLEKVTHSAYSQVLQLGFSERLGLVGYQDQQDMLEEPIYSDATAKLADEEVRSLVAEVRIASHMHAKAHEHGDRHTCTRTPQITHRQTPTRSGVRHNRPPSRRRTSAPRSCSRTSSTRSRSSATSCCARRCSCART